MDIHRPKAWRVVNEKDYIDLSTEELTKLEDWFEKEREEALCLFESDSISPKKFGEWNNVKKLINIARNFRDTNLKTITFSNGETGLSYRWFLGSVVLDYDLDILFGKVQGINDVITFKATTVGEVKEEFVKSVEEYLQFCRSLNNEIT